MTIYWRCLLCPAVGTTDGGAQKHTKETTHPTITSTRPPKDESEA